MNACLKTSISLLLCYDLSPTHVDWKVGFVASRWSVIDAEWLVQLICASFVRVFILEIQDKVDFLCTNWLGARALQPNNGEGRPKLVVGVNHMFHSRDWTSELNQLLYNPLRGCDSLYHPLEKSFEQTLVLYSSSSGIIWSCPWPENFTSI